MQSFKRLNAISSPPRLRRSALVRQPQVSTPRKATRTSLRALNLCRRKASRRAREPVEKRRIIKENAKMKTPKQVIGAMAIIFAASLALPVVAQEKKAEEKKAEKAEKAEKSEKGEGA